MTTELQAAIARLEYVSRDEQIPQGLAVGAKLSEDVAAVLAALSSPPADDFCDQCAGPYDGWLKDQYGGHWDTCPNRVASPPADDVREALEAIWDDGNATGLDGYGGPGRGTLPIDPEAVEARNRCIERHAAALEVRLRGTITDTAREAVTALNAALTHTGTSVMRERALADAAILARRALLREARS